MTIDKRNLTEGSFFVASFSFPTVLCLLRTPHGHSTPPDMVHGADIFCNVSISHRHSTPAIANLSKVAPWLCQFLIGIVRRFNHYYVPH